MVIFAMTAVFASAAEGGWFVTADKKGTCKVVQAKDKAPGALAGPFKTAKEAKAARSKACEKSKLFWYKVKSKDVKPKVKTKDTKVKPAPKPEVVRTYSPEEEAKFVKLVNDGKYLEAIAEALGRPVNSVRGKALSLLRAGEINAIPRQEHTKGASRKDPLAELGDILEMTVEDIAAAIGKTVRGVKAMLTRRGISVADYDGAARREKAEAAAEAK
jgi:DNA-binding transcriptional ArsR family regulator